MKTKTCYVCKKTWNIDNFYKIKTKYKDKVYECYRGICKICHSKETDKWRKKNYEQYKNNYRTARHTMKIKLLKEMGGKCICCGCKDYWNLTYDHIKPIKRKNRARTDMTQKLIKNKELRKKFQILCYGCNLSKNVYEKCVLNHELVI